MHIGLDVGYCYVSSLYTEPTDCNFIDLNEYECSLDSDSHLKYNDFL